MYYSHRDTREHGQNGAAEDFAAPASELSSALSGCPRCSPDRTHSDQRHASPQVPNSPNVVRSSGRKGGGCHQAAPRWSRWKVAGMVCWPRVSHCYCELVEEPHHPTILRACKSFTPLFKVATRRYTARVRVSRNVPSHHKLHRQR